MDDGYPSERWRHTLSWWWVAELVRRHPDLVVWEQVTRDGHQDSLVIARPIGDKLDRRMEINRNGNIELPGRQIPLVDGPWGRPFDADDPHAVIRHLESAAGLGQARPVPDPPPSSLALRLIAATLMAKVYDERAWTCRTLDTGLPDTFHVPAATEPDAPGRRWVVRADEDAVAVVVLDGEVYLSGEAAPRSIVEAYEENDRRLIPTMAALLAPVL